MLQTWANTRCVLTLAVFDDATAAAAGGASNAASARASRARRHAPAASTDASDDEADSEYSQPGAAEAVGAAGGGGAGAAEPGSSWDRPFIQHSRWLAQPDPSDPVVTSHYRQVISFTADDPAPLVPGGLGRQVGPSAGLGGRCCPGLPCPSAFECWAAPTTWQQQCRAQPSRARRCALQVASPACAWPCTATPSCCTRSAT